MYVFASYVVLAMRNESTILHTLSKLYDVPVGFEPPPYFEAEYCLFCGRRRVAVARYRMICLVRQWSIAKNNRILHYCFTIQCMIQPSIFLIAHVLYISYL